VGVTSMVRLRPACKVCKSKEARARALRGTMLHETHATEMWVLNLKVNKYDVSKQHPATKVNHNFQPLHLGDGKIKDLQYVE
jgi:hypothetical protein